jgi:hypothetical protein
VLTFTAKEKDIKLELSIQFIGHQRGSHAAGVGGNNRVIWNPFLRRNFVILPKLRRNWRGGGGGEA